MRTIPTALLLGGAVLLAGCVSGSSRVSQSGTYVSDETLGRFESGVTTEAQVLELLGPPDKTVGWKEDSTLHVWRHESRSRSSGSVGLFVSGRSESVRQRSVYVACRGGVVLEHWSDSLRH
jgi:hypothetical protein